MGVIAGDRHENVQLAFICVLAFQVLPIAHIHTDAIQSLRCGITGQQRKLRVKGFDPLPQPVLFCHCSSQCQQRFAGSASPLLYRPLSQFTADTTAKLIIKSQKQLRIILSDGKPEDIHHIPNGGMGKKAGFLSPAGIGYSLFVQQIYQGQGAFMIAIQHRQLSAQSSLLGQICILTPPAGNPVAGNRLSLRIGRSHVFGMAVGILPDKTIGSSHNGPGGAVVGLQIENLCPGPVGFKIGECLRPCRTEAVDALILIAHHKQISTLRSQQANNGMLNFGGVLGFVHVKITVFILPCPQKLGL